MKNELTNLNQKLPISIPQFSLTRGQFNTSGRYVELKFFYLKQKNNQSKSVYSK